jgi:hypothetical protein
MKYIKISNAGEIQPQALHLVGASTKRGDNTKIGQFGSGNKYALAYLLRNGYSVDVYAGESQIQITTEQEQFRDNTFNVIYIDGQRTSITTEMGKDWQFWQAMREIYCNAIDEGDSSIEYVNSIVPVAGQTHFYIEAKHEARDFTARFDDYFAQNKRVLFECELGRILEKSGTAANIYRKGIRCHNSTKTSVYDYDFADIPIDENRLVKYYWNVEERLWTLLFRCTNRDVIMQVLHNSDNSDYIEGCVGDIATINAAGCSDEFMECLRTINVAPKGYAGLLKPDEVHTHVILPTKIFQSLRGVLDDNQVGDRFKVGRAGNLFREVEPHPLHQATMSNALEFLSQCRLNIPYQIVFAIFDNPDYLGCADGERIVISLVCVERGVNECVNTILEEYIHIKYRVLDETRAFQTAIIAEFITYMKTANAYVI